MAGTSESDTSDTPLPAPVGNPRMAAVAAWLLPGAGHFYLGKRRRAIAFLVLVIVALLIGYQLEGRAPWTFTGPPLSILATLGCLGSGAPYLWVRLGLGYQGTVEAAAFEYGSAFILTAGLMNLLLILDAWDISTGKKA